MKDKKIPNSREQKSPTVPSKRSAPSHGGNVAGGRAPTMKPKANNTKGC